MTALAEAGAIILPASPSFYSHPRTVDDLTATVVDRAVEHLGVERQHYEFEGRADK